MGLGVGHEAQDPAGGVRDPGDVQERAVGVVGKPARRPRCPSALAYFKAIWPRSEFRRAPGAAAKNFPSPWRMGSSKWSSPLVKTQWEVSPLS